MKGIPWYRVPERKMHFSVSAAPDIDIAPFVKLEEDRGRPVAVRRLTDAIKQRLFDSLDPQQ